MQRAPDAPIEAPKFLGHGSCLTHHRSDRMRATNDAHALMHTAWPMVLKLAIPPSDVRGLAISLGKLAPVHVELEQPRLAFPKKEEIEATPPGSLFQIPSASQIDVEAIEHLPERMRHSVQAALDARTERPPPTASFEALAASPVSYTHLTLPTNREV